MPQGLGESLHHAGGVGQGQQLHGLGVDLGEVRAEADIVRHRLGLGGEIALEAVAQLVGIYGDVAGGAGAVGKNEGHPVRLGQLLAEAHAGLRSTFLRERRSHLFHE